MAGTDGRREMATGGPAVILVEPQLGENIGMVARAMLNCGLVDLRLVRPRDGWPNARATSPASGATVVLEGARVFDTTAAAIADLTRVYAATARPRDMILPVLTPRRGADEMRCAMDRGARVGVLFGGERAGLHNDDITCAEAVLEVPLNAAFHSLNLSQAVLLVAYEWFQAQNPSEPVRLPESRTPAATKEELMNFFNRLETALDTCGFFHVAEKRPIVVRNIRNFFQRAELREQEVKILHGIVTCLFRGSDSGRT
jgi:tRNA/rRNA methyltransferase